MSFGLRFLYFLILERGAADPLRDPPKKKGTLQESSRFPNVVMDPLLGGSIFWIL